MNSTEYWLEGNHIKMFSREPKNCQETIRSKNYQPLMVDDLVMTGSWSGYTNVLIERKLQFKGKPNLMTKSGPLRKKTHNNINARGATVDSNSDGAAGVCATMATATAIVPRPRPRHRHEAARTGSREAAAGKPRLRHEGRRTRGRARARWTATVLRPRPRPRRADSESKCSRGQDTPPPLGQDAAWSGGGATTATATRPRLRRGKDATQ